MGGGPLLPKIRKTKYFSVHDVPDELVEQYSKRDPENMLYQTRRWVNFKKKQILFNQNDGVPDYKRTPLSRVGYPLLWAGVLSMTAYNFYCLWKHQKK